MSADRTPRLRTVEVEDVDHDTVLLGESRADAVAAVAAETRVALDRS